MSGDTQNRKPTKHNRVNTLVGRGHQKQHELEAFWILCLPLLDLAEGRGQFEGHSILECQADLAPRTWTLSRLHQDLEYDQEYAFSKKGRKY